MKPLSFNLKKAKKIAADKHSSTFALDNGHKILVAHASLSPEHRKQIQAIPLYSGGEVQGPISDEVAGEGAAYDLNTTSENWDPEKRKQMQPEVEPSPTPAAKSAPSGDISSPDYDPTLDTNINHAKRMAKGGRVYMDDGGPISVATSPSKIDLSKAKEPEPEQQQPLQDPISMLSPFEQSPSAPESNLIPTPQPNGYTTTQTVNGPTASTPPANVGAPPKGSTDKTPPPPPSPIDLNKAYQQGVSGIKEGEDVAAAMASRNDNSETNYIKQRNDIDNALKQNTADFQKQQQLFLDDYKNNHINPNQFVENMGTFQRAKTAIGLLLGGFAAGFGHTNNPAMDFLNNQINRDIEAQKMNMDKQHNLMSANQALYHDQILANNATRMNLNDIYSHEIQQNAAKLGTAAAIANADKALSAFALQNANLLQQNAIRATAMHAIETQGGAGLTPMHLGNAGLIPMEQATKEQSAYDSKRAAIVNGNKAYDNAQQQNVWQKVWSPLQSPAELGVDQAALSNGLLQAAPSKRYSTEMAEALVKPYLPYRTDPQSVVETKRQGYLDLINKESAGEMPMSGQYIRTTSSTPPPQPFPVEYPQQYKVVDKKTGQVSIGTANKNGQIIRNKK